MSDTAIPEILASSAEFDARLKRSDEARWLATRYAPPPGRERLVALYLVHQELQRALSASEPMLGKIRIQWWRETLEGIAGPGPVRRHDLALELARILAGRGDLIPAVHDLIDRHDDVIDDHLHAGAHPPTPHHEARHMAAEASLARLAGRALDAGARTEDLELLARLGEANLSVRADLPDAAARWTAAKAAARNLPATLWPAIAHLAAAERPGAGKGPLAKRWAVFRAVLARRL